MKLKQLKHTIRKTQRSRKDIKNINSRGQMLLDFIKLK